MKIKRLLSLLLAWNLVLSLLPKPLPTSAATNAAGTVTTSDQCGNDLTWTLDDQGVLTISGSGDMKNYYGSDVPRYQYRSKIKTVTLPEGVTSIGYYAFSDYSGDGRINVGDIAQVYLIVKKG